METKIRNLNKIIFLILGVLVLQSNPGLFTSLAFAKEKEVELKAQVSQKVFRVGEPVIVHLTLSNLGKRPIEFNELRLDTTETQYWIKPADGSYQEYKPSFIDEPCCGLIKLPPAGTHYYDELIHFNYATNSLAFPKPGTYTVKVIYDGYISTESLPEPAEVFVEVIENSLRDRRMANFFSQEEIASFINNTSIDSAVIKRLEAEIKRFPKSLFSRYGNYYLALYKAQRYEDKEPDLEAAVSLMKKADIKDWQLQPKVLLYLAQWMWQLGNSQEAFSYLERVIKDYPESSAAKSAINLKESFSEQEPPPKPLEKPKLMAALKKAMIYLTLREYFSAFQRGDLTTCMAKLDKDFRYNEVLDKNKWQLELKEDFQKLKQEKGSLKVRWKVDKWEMIEEIPAVEVKLSYLVDGKLLSAPSKIRIELISKQGQWLFKSLKVIGRE